MRALPEIEIPLSFKYNSSLGIVKIITAEIQLE
jgi:hypothetical protein